MRCCTGEGASFRTVWVMSLLLLASDRLRSSEATLIRKNKALASNRFRLLRLIILAPFPGQCPLTRSTRAGFKALDDIAFCCQKRDLADPGEVGVDGNVPGVEQPFGDVAVVAMFHAPGAELRG
jgi:hypothetical protein